MKKTNYFICFTLLLIAIFFADNAIAQTRTCNDNQTDEQFPPRQEDARTGSELMELMKTMTLEEREELIIEEVLNGNTPSFCKTFVEVEFQYNGHTAIVEVLPDYLAIGSDEDFCRIPVSPETAQVIADTFDCSLPTPLMVDKIWENAEIKITPITHAPNGNDNEQIWMFQLHNTEIEDALSNYGTDWNRDTTIVGGLKKDIVITNRLSEIEDKVAIYGWHKPDGTIWQPLYTGHTNTYMDYSHGVRYVNQSVLVNNQEMNIKDILADVNLYKLLSDENGIMEQPYYVHSGSPVMPDKVKSWGIKIVDENSIRILYSDVEEALSYRAYISTDNQNFDRQTGLSQSEEIIADLQNNTFYYVKLKASNENGDSPFSETLTVFTTNETPDALVVQAFDRPTAGNTRDFNKYHTKALQNAGIYADCATNDAVINGLFDLNNYEIVDYVLGDESTADETFNTTEQNKITQYLQSGGKLFVSGAEIAWDLDHKGSSADRSFCHNILKIKYIYDAPQNSSGTFYSAEPYNNSVFDDLQPFDFDNGTHGTINVKYPDQIEANGGSSPFLQYSGTNSTSYAAVFFSGLFSGGSQYGKIITMGFPYESIYPETVRYQFMQCVAQYFALPFETNIEKRANEDNLTVSIYPNPVSDQLTIELCSANRQKVTVILYDNAGKEVAVLYNSTISNKTVVTKNLENFNSGCYWCVVKQSNSSNVSTNLVILQK